MSPYLAIQFSILMLAAGRNELDKKDEEELYAAIKEGDPSAFKKFFDIHFDSLHAFLTSHKVRPDIADDLIQTAFVYIWENRSQIKPGLSLKSYLYRIAYTRMLNHFKSAKKMSLLEPDAQTGDHNPADKMEYRDLKSSLDQAVEQLPEKRRIVFTSCFIRELTYRETAEILDISIKTVETHMALALRDIRSALKQFHEFN
ncbi:MAG: sigma-70 family RNA polymerase sigma factor [Balneolaceae bacterium]